MQEPCPFVLTPTPTCPLHTHAQGMLEGQDAYTSGKIGGDDDDLFQ